MTLEIHTLPVISTAHLTKEVADRLTAEGKANPWCAVAEWDYGYFIHLDDLESGLEKPPRCLLDIRNWLRDLERRRVVDNCRWLRLDSDAEKIEGLPTYDW